MRPSTTGLGVVLTPGLIAAGFVYPESRAVLCQWRDGALRPVLDRALFRRYLQTLRALGFSEARRRRWAWWFTDAVKVHFVDDELPEGLALAELVGRLAVTTGASWVIGPHPQSLPLAVSEAGCRWVDPATFLRRD